MTEHWLADGDELQRSNHVNVCIYVCTHKCVCVCMIEMGHNSAGQAIRLVVVIFCPASRWTAVERLLTHTHLYCLAMKCDTQHIYGFNWLGWWADTWQRRTAAGATQVDTDAQIISGLQRVRRRKRRLEVQPCHVRKLAPEHPSVYKVKLRVNAFLMAATVKKLTT